MKMKKNNEDFKAILKEWKNFVLNESVKEKFKKSDEGKSVIIKSCCSECKEYFKKNKLNDNEKGKLVNINLNDREIIPNGRRENFVLVRNSKEEKQYPQCCIKLG